MSATKIDEINQNAYLNPNKKEMATTPVLSPG